MKVKKYDLDTEKLFEPTEKWGPAKREDRIKYQHERTDGISYIDRNSEDETQETMLSKI